MLYELLLHNNCHTSASTTGFTSKPTCSEHVAGECDEGVVGVQAYGVWWFPPMVLNCAAVLLSLAWGLLIFTLSWLRWQAGPNGTAVSPYPPPPPAPSSALHLFLSCHSTRLLAMCDLPGLGLAPWCAMYACFKAWSSLHTMLSSMQ